MIPLKQRVDLIPLCPYCQEEVGTVYFQELRGILGRRYIYFCPRCLRVLGISHRKGFLMG